MGIEGLKSEIGNLRSEIGPVRGKLRKALSGIAGRHWIVILAMVKAFSDGMLGIGLSLKLVSLGWSYWDLGLFGGVLSTIYTLTCVVYSLVLHRMALRRMLSLSAVVGAAAAVGLWFFSATPLLFLFGAASLAASAFFWPSLMAWVGEGQEEHLVGDMAAFNCAWTLALTAGYLVSGQVEAARAELSLPLVALVLVVLALVAPWAHIRGTEAFPVTAVSPPATPVLPRRFLFAGWLAALVATLAVAVPGTIFVKLSASLGYGPGAYSRLFVLQGAVQAFVFLALGVLQGWRYRRWPLVAALVLAAAGSTLLTLPLGGGAFAWNVLAAGFMLLGAGMGIGYCTGFYYTVRGSLNRRRGVALFEAIISVQHIAGSILGGLVATVVWQRAPYAVIAALAVVGVLVQLSLLRGVGGPAAEPAAGGGEAATKP